MKWARQLILPGHDLNHFLSFRFIEFIGTCGVDGVGQCWQCWLWFISKSCQIGQGLNQCTSTPEFDQTELFCQIASALLLDRLTKQHVVRISRKDMWLQKWTSASQFPLHSLRFLDHYQDIIDSAEYSWYSFFHISHRITLSWYECENCFVYGDNWQFIYNSSNHINHIISYHLFYWPWFDWMILFKIHH